MSHPKVRLTFTVLEVLYVPSQSKVDFHCVTYLMCGLPIHCNADFFAKCMASLLSHPLNLFGCLCHVTSASNSWVSLSTWIWFSWSQTGAYFLQFSSSLHIYASLIKWYFFFLLQSPITLSLAHSERDFRQKVSHVCSYPIRIIFFDFFLLNKHYHAHTLCCTWCKKVCHRNNEEPEQLRLNLTYSLSKLCGLLKSMQSGC